MFAHPRCPCTRASVGELALIMRQCYGKVSAHVLIYEPGSSPGGWEQTDLWRRAGAIPGVHVHKDPAGVAARLFGATTSGAVVVYDASGRLVFHGGVTGSRGHSGDNAGRSSVVALINGELPGRHESFVYGCSIFGEAVDDRPVCCREEPR
jgi:hypothetical protein